MSKSKEELLLESAIDRAIRELGNHDVISAEYAKTLDRVVTLHKMLVEDKPNQVSKDTMAVVGANLLGIVLIIKHEFVNVVTSRAMSLLIKPRI
jgi:hypothetical protein